MAWATAGVTRFGWFVQSGQRLERW